MRLPNSAFALKLRRWHHSFRSTRHASKPPTQRNTRMQRANAGASSLPQKPFQFGG
jgi:hypothetical protein